MHFIFSNNQNLYTKRFVLDLPIHRNDSLIMMNRAYPVMFDKIRCHPKKFVFLRVRNNFDRGGYWGIEWLQPQLFRDVYFMGGPLRKAAPGFKWKLDFYPEDKYPTTGFLVVMYYMQQLGIENVTLVNFTFDRNMWDKHDFEFEKHYVEEQGFKNIVL